MGFARLDSESLELLRPLRRSATDFKRSQDRRAAQREALCSIPTAVVHTLPQSILSVLHSQNSLHQDMACIIQVILYIHIRSILWQLVLERNRRSTWDMPMLRSQRCTTWRPLWWNNEARRQRAHNQHSAPLSWHPNGIHEKGQFWLAEGRNWVRRNDTAWRWRSTQLHGSTKFWTEWVRPKVGKDRVCIFIVW